MIRNVEAWERWEAEYRRSVPHDYRENLRIAEAIYEHARKVGALPRKDLLESLNWKIEFVARLHGRPFRPITTSDLARPSGPTNTP